LKKYRSQTELYVKQGKLWYYWILNHRIKDIHEPIMIQMNERGGMDSFIGEF
jgi:hypothetical protein